MRPRRAGEHECYDGERDTALRYYTESVLCVPVLDINRKPIAVIELLNAEKGE